MIKPSRWWATPGGGRTPEPETGTEMEDKDGQVEAGSRRARACGTVGNGREWMAIAQQGGLLSVLEFAEEASSPRLWKLLHSCNSEH